MPATLFFDAMLLSRIKSFFAWSMIIWYLTSICLVRSTNWLVLVTRIQPSIFSDIRIGVGSILDKTLSFSYQRASWTANKKAMYSASGELWAIMLCFWFFQLIALPDTIKTYQVTDFLFICSWAQSESQHPVTTELEPAKCIKPILNVPRKYWRRCFDLFQWPSSRLCR